MFWRRRQRTDRKRSDAQEDKHEGNNRPDQPTPSDEATLVERGEGAHAEFVETPPPAPSPSRDEEEPDTDRDRR